MGGTFECGFWSSFVLATIEDMGPGLCVLPQIPAIIQKNCEKLQDCRVCHLRASEWQWHVQQSISAIPRFRV